MRFALPHCFEGIQRQVVVTEDGADWERAQHVPHAVLDQPILRIHQFRRGRRPQRVAGILLAGAQ